MNHRILSSSRIATTIVGIFLSLLLPRFAGAQASWTLRNPAISPGSLLWSICEGNAGIVAVGSNGKILHASDGKTWSAADSGTSAWLVAVTFGNGRYIAVGDNGTILSSTDGVTWSRISQTGTTARLNNVLYAQNHFVAVGEGGTVVVSDTGDKWAPTSSNVTSWLHGLAYGGGYWIATGEAGAITTSKDGLTWTSHTPTTTKALEAVAFSTSVRYTYTPTSYTIETRFLAVGQDGVGLICYMSESTYSSSSYNSFYTVPTATGVSVRLGSLSVYNNVFIATGDNGTVITSKSERGPWTKIDLGTAYLINASGFGKSSLFLAGEGETIYQSEPIFPSRLCNVSTRGNVSLGANVMIAGMVIDGVKPKHYRPTGIPKIRQKKAVRLRGLCLL